MKLTSQISFGCRPRQTEDEILSLKTMATPSWVALKNEKDSIHIVQFKLLSEKTSSIGL